VAVAVAVAVAPSVAVAVAVAPSVAVAVAVAPSVAVAVAVAVAVVAARDLRPSTKNQQKKKKKKKKVSTFARKNPFKIKFFGIKNLQNSFFLLKTRVFYILGRKKKRYNRLYKKK
jgi:hypothetical protein